MPTVIDKKITGYSIATPKVAESVVEVKPDIIHMHEGIERPEVLVGMTYKIKSPLVEHALYVTINDIVLNAGTDHEVRRPFEIFINSKSMEHFQWIVGFTRILSAVFRKGGDVIFLIEEMRSVFDPKGGYFKSGGKYMPSLIAEIGQVIEDHLVAIGAMKRTGISPEEKALIAEKMITLGNSMSTPDATFPNNATLCVKCSVKAVIVMDGCQTCLNCADSKCG
jgi:hypothetical protein